MTDLELDSLDLNVKDLGDKAELEALRANIYSYECDKEMQEITDTLDSLVDDTLDEIALLAKEILAHSNQLKVIEDADYSALLDELANKVNATKDLLNTIDSEHLKLIEELTGKVAEQTDKITETTSGLDGIIKHLVISEEDYFALGTPDEDVLYFTYEK